MRTRTYLISGLAACLMSTSMAMAASGTSHDLVRLSDPVQKDGQWHVALSVENSRELAGLDIPLRFAQSGQSIELVRVDFTDRVADWDFKHAQIDNQAKTVIIGLISELVNVRPAADLKVSAQGDSRIADLVFETHGDAQPEFSVLKTTAPGHDLTFLFNENVAGRLEVQELKPELEQSVNFKESTLPTTFGLTDGFPNPFNPSTSFTLSLPEASDYSVKIFNVAGQVVRSMDGHLQAGEHRLIWDGRSQQGQPVASGTYFFKAQAGTFEATRKMTLLK